MNDNKELDARMENQTENCSRPHMGHMHMGPGMMHGGMFPMGGFWPGFWPGFWGAPFLGGMSQGFCPFGENCPNMFMNPNMPNMGGMPNMSSMPMTRYYIDGGYGYYNY